MKLFILNLISSITFTNASYWQANPEVPFELAVLVKSFETKKLSKEENDSLKKSIEQINTLFSSMSKPDRHFMAKSTIYQWVLKSAPKNKIPDNFKVESILTKEFKNLTPFSSWLFTALKSDIENMISSDFQINEKYQAHVNLIRPWVYFFSKEESAQIEVKMIDFRFDLLKKVISHLELFQRFKQIDHKNSISENLAFFNLINKNLPIDSNQNVLEKLDSIIEKHQKLGLPLPTDEWKIGKNDEWTPKEGPNQESLKQKDYQPPQKLPEPVNDWNFE